MDINIKQTVAILVDGNNIERSLKSEYRDEQAVLNFDTCIPRLLNGRSLNRLIYFKEGIKINKKLQSRLHRNFFGLVKSCHKSADIPLTIKATQLASKVDTIIIMSGDADYIELVKHLKHEGVRVEIASVHGTTAYPLTQECDFHSYLKEDDIFSIEPEYMMG